MFVRRIPYQSVRRRKIHNWLLLFVRMTALALLIAAFARPLILQSDAAGADRRRRTRAGGAARYELQHGLRRSLGARAQSRGRTRSGRCRVRSRLGRALFVGHRDPRAVVAEREKLTAALATAKPGAGATRYAPGAQGGRKHPVRLEAAAPRGGADQRFPAQRLARRGGGALPQGAMFTPVPVQGPLDRPERRRHRRDARRDRPFPIRSV